MRAECKPTVRADQLFDWGRWWLRDLNLNKICPSLNNRERTNLLSQSCIANFA